MRLVGPLLVFAASACGRHGFETSDVDAVGDGVDGFVAPCTGPDEDGDAWPDSCDSCPTVADATQLDTDGDNVGDACDPRPTTSGDRILFFDGFNAPDARYQTFGVTQYVPGAYRLGDVTTSGQAFFDTPLTVTRIAIAYQIVAYSLTDTQWIGVWSQIDAANTTKIFSEGAWAPGAGNLFFRIKETDQGVDRYSPDLLHAAPWPIGETFHSVTDTARATGGNFRLTMTAPGAAPQSTELAIAIPPGERGFLEAELLTADFLYLIVYDAP